MGSGDVGVPIEGCPDRPVRHSRPAPNHLGLEMAVIRVESQGVVKAIRQEWLTQGEFEMKAECSPTVHCCTR